MKERRPGGPRLCRAFLSLAAGALLLSPVVGASEPRVDAVADLGARGNARGGGGEAGGASGLITEKTRVGDEAGFAASIDRSALRVS